MKPYRLQKTKSELSAHYCVKGEVREDKRFNQQNKFRF